MPKMNGEMQERYERRSWAVMNNPHFARRYEPSPEHLQNMEAWRKREQTKLDAATNEANLRAARKRESEIAQTRETESSNKREAESRQRTRDWEREEARKRQAPSEDTQKRLNKAMQEFYVVQEQWLSYELDILKVVENPFMFDMRETEAREFSTAMQRLAVLFGKKKTEILSLTMLDALERDVSQLMFLWETLRQISERIRDSSFKDGERARIDRAKKLLSIAMNIGSSASERQVAYRKAIRELSQVIVVPARAMEELESRMPLLAIEA